MDSLLPRLNLPVLSPTGRTVWENLKTALIVYLVFSRVIKAERHVRARGLVQSVRDAYTWVIQESLLLALRTLPSAKKKVETELGKARLDIERKLVPQGPNVTRHLSLPEQGHDTEWILAEMAKMDEEAGSHVDWRNGRVSGAVYHGGKDMEKVIIAAMERYCLSNPLHPDVFPAVRKMEAEIVAMVLKMYNNPNGAGTTTGGGTESIIMAVKTHRDWARATKGITEPEMVVPISAHAAFDKGAAYLGVKVHTIPIHPETRQVDIKRVARAINRNTIMIVGSAINFPDGNQDDIVALGKLAAKHKIGLHVDCCLGSFIMPYLEEAGFPGNSVIMYRDAALRRFQYYVNPDWMGGVYGSPSIAGSRPGALIAGTWAALQYMGHAGYLESCKTIVSAAKTIVHRIRTEIPELRILGDPPASVVAFAAAHGSSVNALEVGDAMSKKGWHLNAVSNPAAVHIAVTRLTVPVVDQFIADLKDAVRDAKLAPSGQGTMVMLYGLGQSSPVGPTMVGHVAEAFLDTMYKA
ncbi:hypothetical protein ONZ51_g8322 [Trametes cubensis]|uniref:sphinganine-1-phosphate aldolase n=1 Tax=Trametes cubensis TaxID=1111947 RepID=A0AAD7TNX1_9APHY|nr:hypothetical protein ONZ51_g8322 [Trametes cubensis]